MMRTMRSVYLDYNATTPIAPEVLAAMMPYLGDEFGNPSSGHALGRRARAAIDDARSEVARLIGAEPDEIVFTSGGTEANNLAIAGVMRAVATRRHVVTSTIEHPATVEPCKELARRGCAVTWVAVDDAAQVDAEAVAAIVRDDTALVSIMHSNNEVGTLQPIAAIARAGHARGALVHTDAAQSIGKVPIDVRELGVDLLSIAGHKLHAPKGVGALYVRRGIPIAPVVRGASHERGLRPGTENVASIVALGRACGLAHDGIAGADRVRMLRDRLWNRLRAAAAEIALNGHATDRLPNTLSVRFPRVRGTALLARVEDEIFASTGSACHDGRESPSSVLRAMGLDDDAALGTVRISLGRATTEQDVDTAAEALTREWIALADDDAR